MNAPYFTATASRLILAECSALLRQACKTDVSNEDCRKLFALLDEDGGGTLECGELIHALRTNPEAKALAEKFESLLELVKLSTLRKRRRQGSNAGGTRRERMSRARARRKSRGELKRRKTATSKEMAEATS